MIKQVFRFLKSNAPGNLRSAEDISELVKINDNFKYLDNGKVSKAGDTITKASGPHLTYKTTVKASAYTDFYRQGDGATRSGWMGYGSALNDIMWVRNESGPLYLQGVGDTVSEQAILLPGAPTADLHAATKAYVDATQTSGSWTPSITAVTTNPTCTYSTRTGYYIKTGKLVFAQFVIGLSAISGGSGTVKLSGLPFAMGSQNGMKKFDVTFTNTTGITVKECGAIDPGANNTYVYLTYATHADRLAVANLTATLLVFGTISYIAA